MFLQRGTQIQNTAPTAGLANVCGVKMNGFTNWYGMGNCLVWCMWSQWGRNKISNKGKVIT